MTTPLIDHVSVEEQRLLDVRSPTADINVFVIGGCWDIQTYQGLNGIAYRISDGNRSGVTKRERKAIYIAGEKLIASNPIPEDLLLQEIAHKIGHVFIGSGHPDYESGPAALRGTNRLERLMFSDGTVKKNKGFIDRNLLVKKEWDEADNWLKPNIDDKEPQ